MLPKDALMKGCHDRQGLATLIDQAETVLRTWQPSWSDFLHPKLREEALSRLSVLTELEFASDGGFPSAERQRLYCRRRDESFGSQLEIAPIQGLLIEGNFLFDPITPQDLRCALESLGARPDSLGDIWIRGDRGGQAVCTPELACQLDGRTGLLRSVEIRCEATNHDQLQLPATRVKKRLTSVEASCRLDAIASAGFGLSRAKVVNQIKQGRLRLNWQPVKNASRELAVGDCLQLQARGSLEVISLELTKRQRWRVEMIRS